MEEAIENVIDDWLQARIETQMGKESAYTTLKLRTVEPVLVKTLHGVENEGWEYPACGFGNAVVLRDPNGFGRGIIWAKRIPYVLTYVTYGKLNRALRDARTLLTRNEAMLKTVSASDYSSLVTANNEKVTDIVRLFGGEGGNELGIGVSRIRRIPNPKDKGNWWVAADFTILFKTSTG